MHYLHSKSYWKYARLECLVIITSVIITVRTYLHIMYGMISYAVVVILTLCILDVDIL